MGKKITIEDMRIIAESRGGKFVSEKFIGVKHKHTWECNLGHRWEATPNNITHKPQPRWCPECKFIKLHKLYSFTFEELNSKLAPKQIRCISSDYKNTNKISEFECQICKCKWFATASHVLRDTGCPGCAGNKKKSIEDMQQLAKNKGGKCLSTKYINSDSNLEWICSKGHKWLATGNNINRGTWCPDCLNLIQENICREHFEYIFNKRFTKVRPLWLKIGKQARLELDGYCEELKIAFEYNGAQHHIFDHYFWKKGNFIKQCENDAIKRQRCLDQGVTLIEIPYTVSKEELLSFICNELRSRGKYPDLPAQRKLLLN